METCQGLRVWRGAVGERRHANRNNPERSLRASPLPGLSTLCKQSVCRLLTAITGDRVKFLVHCGYTTRPRLPAIGTPQFAGYYLLLWWASLVAQRLKRLPGMRETWVQSLDPEDQLEKEMGTHSSTLAWRIAWREEPGGLQSMGLQTVGHDWVTSLPLSPPLVPITWVAYDTVAKSQTITKADGEAHAKGGKQSQPTVPRPMGFPPSILPSGFLAQPQVCTQRHSGDDRCTPRRKAACLRRPSSLQTGLHSHSLSRFPASRTTRALPASKAFPLLGLWSILYHTVHSPQFFFFFPFNFHNERVSR